MISREDGSYYQIGVPFFDDNMCFASSRSLKRVWLYANINRWTSG